MDTAAIPMNWKAQQEKAMSTLSAAERRIKMRVAKIFISISKKQRGFQEWADERGSTSHCGRYHECYDWKGYE